MAWEQKQKKEDDCQFTEYYLENELKDTIWLFQDTPTFLGGSFMAKTYGLVV